LTSLESHGIYAGDTIDRKHQLRQVSAAFIAYILSLELLVRDRHRQWGSQPDCIDRAFLHTEIAVKTHFWMGYNWWLSLNFAKTFGAKEYILSTEVSTFTTIDTLLIIYFWWHNLTPQFVEY
jgi:hypothetical protein